MTLVEMRTEVFELLGELTDLDPAVSTTRLDFAINEGAKHIAMWKEPRLGQVRFRELMGSMYFQATVRTETLDAGSTTSSLILDSNGPSVDNAYLDWVVQVGSEYALVVGYTASTKTVALAIAVSSAPASADTVTFYPSHFLVLPSSSNLVSYNIARPEGYFETLKVIDMYQQKELDNTERTEGFYTTTTEIGDPTEFFRYSNGLIFNSAVSTDRYFKLEYYRTPTLLTLDTDEPELPEAFHYAIVLWALWWGYRRGQENSSAYSVKRDLMDFMRTTKTQYDVYMERSSGYGYLKRG